MDKLGYRETFILYLEAADILDELQQRYVLCDEFKKIIKMNPDNYAEIALRNDVVLSAYQMLMEHYPSTSLDKSLRAFEGDCEIRQKIEDMLFCKLESKTASLFGIDREHLLITRQLIASSRFRRNHYKQLLISEEKVMSPDEMELDFASKQAQTFITVSTMKQESP